MAFGNACLFVLLCAFTASVNGVVSEINYEWAEPSGSRKSMNIKRLSTENSLERLQALRAEMRTHVPRIDAYVIPTADAHNSEYIAPTDARREWISGFSGSAGTALVTQDYALGWTDGRYFTQFEVEVDTSLWTLMKQGQDVTLQTWLSTNLTAGSIVGIDPTTYTRSAWTSLQNTLSPQSISLEATSTNLVDEARKKINDSAPPRPNNELIPLPIEYTGRSASEKIADLLNQVETRRVAALLLTALDDIAYTLNLRGSDIPYNPVFFSYLIIKPSTLQSPENAVLFWGDGRMTSDVKEQLDREQVKIEVKPYSEIFDYLTNMADNDLPENSILWLSQDGSEAVHRAAVGTKGRVTTLSTLSPVALMKCYKNNVELEGFKTSHIKDGIAVVRFLKWLHDEVDAGHQVSEVDASDRLIYYRSQEKDFVGPSFGTIAGAGENGAIVHYSPSNEHPRVIKKEDMFLVDSGGQYKDGTTDITRTRHMSSNPSDFQRLAFTRVMKGQIQLATAVFPKGSGGHILDTLARKYLFDVGLNYNHGTGHGVGHYLNVHEGPSGIGSGPMGSDPGISAGMIFSNEPGYYEVGEFGIRHEDIVEVIDINKNTDHIYAATLEDNFGGRGAVGFNTISLVPHQSACLNVSLLNEHEIKYLNDYHARVLSTLGPILKERELFDDYDWLEEECRPISAGHLLMATPIVVLAAVIARFNIFN